jgi:hypothetical protein
MPDKTAGQRARRPGHAIADVRFWAKECRMAKDDERAAGPALTQGEVVAAALDGTRNDDIDRWQGFSQREAAALAQAPATPEAAAKPRAGLVRDGGPAKAKAAG